jgi:hypothetical protein
MQENSDLKPRTRMANSRWVGELENQLSYQPKEGSIGERDIKLSARNPEIKRLHNAAL